MSTASGMPSQALLEAALRRTFTIETVEAPVALQLLAVDAGVPMSERHRAYSACFGLPAGMSAEQGVYPVRHPDGEPSWELFMSPVGPGADGRQRLQAVFHTAAPDDAGLISHPDEPKEMSDE